MYIVFSQQHVAALCCTSPEVAESGIQTQSQGQLPSCLVSDALIEIQATVLHILCVHTRDKSNNKLLTLAFVEWCSGSAVVLDQYS